MALEVRLPAQTPEQLPHPIPQAASIWVLRTAMWNIPSSTISGHFTGTSFPCRKQNPERLERSQFQNAGSFVCRAQDAKKTAGKNLFPSPPSRSLREICRQGGLIKSAAVFLAGKPPFGARALARFNVDWPGRAEAA
jgi:hypothetical protein